MTTLELLLNESHAIFNTASGLKLYKGLESAFAYTSSSITDLLTHKVRPSHFAEVTNVFENLKINQSFNKAEILVLKYELGMIFEGSEVDESEILFYHLKFSDCENLEISPDDSKSLPISLIEEISKIKYLSSFNKVYEKLLNGDSYQVNLTHQFKLKYDCSFSSIYKKFLSSKNLSPFAHSIYIKQASLCLLSNSPECLFEINENVLVTKPIKGSIKDTEDIKSLTEDMKNHCELMIITDLLRNDLSRIGKYFSKVISLKKILNVPGIIHQYSEISVELDKLESLYNILKAIFPGGSITGAPKKRVIEIITEVENESRGFYTGSTILLHKRIKTASINIRTAIFDLERSTFSYGAGGGITLQSSGPEEYEEMGLKVRSFLKLYE